jgi:cytochrome c-type biogenesis protein CcmH/NrfF
MPKRILHVLAICLFAVTMLGAGSPDTRIDKLGHKLVCQCGCGQILLDCNHVGCPVSPVMIDELHKQVATGLPDTGVLNFFIGKYGPIALSEPIRGGFDLVAWIVPFAVLTLATVGVAVLIVFWKRRNDRNSPPPPSSGGTAVLPISSMQDRIRRDTDYDSWSEK